MVEFLIRELAPPARPATATDSALCPAWEPGGELDGGGSVAAEFVIKESRDGDLKSIQQKTVIKYLIYIYQHLLLEKHIQMNSPSNTPDITEL